MPSGKRFAAYEALLPTTRSLLRSGTGRFDSPIAAGQPGDVPLFDLLIFACAKMHGLEVVHDDSHFDEMAKLEA
jgi:predicted nucleic acid-binding protein